MKIERTYADATLGYDEPDEMWLTGASAIEMMSRLGEPLVDKFGQPLQALVGYYLSAATGLVPMR
jgi:hypothetical protein